MSKLKKVGIGVGIFVGVIVTLGVIGSTIANDTLNDLDGSSVSSEQEKNSASSNIETVEPSQPVQPVSEEETLSTEPSMSRACIPDKACFLSGDYLHYKHYDNGKLWWETKYTHEGYLDGPNKIAVHRQDISHIGNTMIIGNQATNDSTSLIEADLCCGWQAEEYVGGTLGYKYQVIQPSPVKITRWTEHETSADYWKDRVEEAVYDYNGFKRSVIVVQDGDTIKQVIDIETGIILLLENNQTGYDNSFQKTELVATNIIQSDSGISIDTELPRLSVKVSPQKASISRGSEQTILVKLTDESGHPIEGASLLAVVTYASGSQNNFSGQSDSSGSWQFSWKIGGNSNTGTFRVEVTAISSSEERYAEGTGFASFTVTTAS